MISESHHSSRHGCLNRTGFELTPQKLDGCHFANLAKSPTCTVHTQRNDVFMAIYATFKLQCLSLAHKTNPFALCRKLLINASRSAYVQLQVLRAAA